MEIFISLTKNGNYKTEKTLGLEHLAYLFRLADILGDPPLHLDKKVAGSH